MDKHDGIQAILSASKTPSRDLREKIELHKRRADVAAKNQLRLKGAARDSASEEEDGAEDSDDQWEAKFHPSKGQYWYNHVTNKEVYEQPRSKHEFEWSLLHKRCKLHWPMMDKWYEATVTWYNKTKMRHRVEYDDGDHEWVNFAENADRVQVQVPDVDDEDGDGDYAELCWKMYRNYLPPQLAERRRAENAARRQKKTDRKLREALRQWVSLSDGDDEHGKVRWLNEKTGEVRNMAPDYLDWVQDETPEGLLFWRNVKPPYLEVRPEDDPLLNDPRFAAHEDSDETLEKKAAAMAELRLHVYLASGLMEKFDAAMKRGDDVATRKALRACLAAEATTRDLGNIVRDARALWRHPNGDDYFASDPDGVGGSPNEALERAYAAELLQRFNDLRVEAKRHKEDVKNMRISMLSVVMPKRRFVCIKCGYGIANTDQFCKTCGAKTTKAKLVVEGSEEYAQAAAFERDLAEGGKELALAKAAAARSSRMSRESRESRGSRGSFEELPAALPAPDPGELDAAGDAAGGAAGDAAEPGVS